MLEYWILYPNDNVILCITFSSLPFELMNSLRSNYQISLSHYSPDTNGIFMKGNILYVISPKAFYRANSWSICNVQCLLNWEWVWCVSEYLVYIHLLSYACSMLLCNILLCTFQNHKI